MSKKGFTLIELLAVIVILAIIALIATPIIIGIINDAKKQSEDRSAELYLDAAKKAIARYQINNSNADFSNITSCDIATDEIVCGTYHIPVEIDKQKPTAGGKLILSKGNVTQVQNLNLGGKYYNTDANNKLVASTTRQEIKFSGTIYRNSTETVKIGGSIVPETKIVYCGIVPGQGNSCTLASIGWDTNEECVAGMAELGFENATCEEGTTTTGLTSYYTEETKSNITQNFYLKHEVEDNIVQASYVCVEYSEDEEPACIRGGVPSEYGSFDGMTEGMSSLSEVTNPTGNIAEIAKTRSYFLSNGGFCYFYDSNSGCDGPTLHFNARADGGERASDGSVSCKVILDGSASCESGS